MPPLPSGDPGDRHGEDDDDLGEDQIEFRPPLPPDDRIWRHPSEVAATGADLATVGRARPRRWPIRRPRMLGLATVSGLVGATLSLGIVAALGGFARETTIVQRNVAVQPVTSSASDDNTIAAIAARTAPSVAAVRITRDGDTSAASALVLRSDGYLMTNAHLVTDATTIEVRLQTGSSIAATLVGTDPLTDVAVLHIDAADLLPAALGSAETLSMGDRIIAIGAADSPGWSPDITRAVVSGLGRRLRAADDTVLHDMIIIDQALGAAAGGGALLDVRGAVVGVTSDIPASAGDSPVRGVAMPIDAAVHVADQIIEQGHARHVWLGIEGTDLSSGEAVDLGIAGGASVSRVIDASPAAAAGFATGDVIVAIDGTTIDSMSHLIVALRAHDPGDQVTLSVRRGDTTVPIVVVLGERQT